MPVALFAAASFCAETAPVVRMLVQDQHGMPIENAVIGFPSSTAASETPVPAIMNQIDLEFVPHVLVVNAGQLVEFPNSDNIRHHVYSFSTPKIFETKLFAGTEADPVLFDKPGVVVLGCNIHDHMIGYIYVAGAETNAITNADGVAEIAATADQFYVWHPSISASHSERVELDLNVDPATGTQVVSLNVLLEPATSHQGGTFGARKFGTGE